MTDDPTKTAARDVIAEAMNDALLCSLCRAPLPNPECGHRINGVHPSCCPASDEGADHILAALAARGIDTYYTRTHAVVENRPPYQTRVHRWMMGCFGAEIAADRMERNHRFLEEALELVQANGCTQTEAHQLVDYVFGRPVGELHQEIGGVMVTLAALCNASGAEMTVAAEAELARVWTKVKQIRAKQAMKPKHSPLPAAPGTAR